MQTITHRIAVVSGGLELGGTSAFLLNFCGELVSRGVPVQVCSLEHLNPFEVDFARLKIPVQVLDERNSIFEDRLKAVFTTMRAFLPTAVIASLGPASFEVLRYVPPGVTRIAMVHSDDALVYETVGRYARWIDIVVGVSRTIVRRLEDIPSLSGAKKLQIAYGVPIPATTRTSRPVGPLRLIYIGRMVEYQKRIFRIVPIAGALSKAGVPFRWTIVGTGPDEAELKSRIRTAELENHFEFVDAINYDRVSEVLSQHDLIVLVSDFEGLPLSLLEAMAAGVVPVAADLESGIKELIGSHNGFRVPADDINAYCAAITALHQDRQVLQSKSHAARETVVKEYSIAAMTDRWMRALEQWAWAVSDITWNYKIRATAPLDAKHSMKYTRIGRFCRRLSKSWRKFVSA